MDPTFEAIVNGAERFIDEQKDFLRSLPKLRGSRRSIVTELLGRLRDTTQAWISLRFCELRSPSEKLQQFVQGMGEIRADLENAILDCAMK